MASLITGSTAVSRSPEWASKGTSTVSKGGGYVFFSDNPEAVDSTDLVDAGKWLNKDTVSGAGFVYLWHHNTTGAPLKHALLVYNPNNFAIKVTSSNHGITNASGDSDSSAWLDYFSGTVTQAPVVINPTSFGVLFQQNINTGNNFGIIAKTNVTNNSTSAAASASFYDVAWVNSYIGATGYAAKKSATMRRGKGPTYYNTISLAAISPSDSVNGVAYQICGSTDYPGVFGTDDLVYITDPAGVCSGLNHGSYGQQMAVTLKVKNTYSTAKNFKIYMGKTGPGFSFPLINMAGVSLSYKWKAGNTYVDMIDTGSVPANSEVTVSFFLVIPAVSSTPFVIGARMA
ncbi:hypothetical protein ACFO9Q_03355 [Paenibacillus sp. GCM10023252]|uniref:hypothetical protein n=1 Tax=Paenibacillus sp. GCM10023252 TaxID=3252649 RepID=UPI003607FCFD